jgi:hypothetical protein
MRLAIVVTTVVSSLALLPSAAGRPADADVGIWTGLGFIGPGGIGRTSDTKTARSEFIILVVVDTVVAVEQSVTMTIALPQGLRWGNDGPDPSEGCAGTAPAVCTGRIESRGGIVDAGWSWDVVADRNGTYEITASVQPAEPDPNPANNTTTFRFEVAAPSSGGGGGSGGGGSAAVTASAVRVTPARPKAGAIVGAAVRVSAGGAAIRPTRVVCAGSVGSARVTGTPRAASGTAACTYRTPRSAKGKTLRGSVVFTARGQGFTRRFATKLG